MEFELKGAWRGETTGAALAISLHATRDDLRDQLVPINRRYPIAELMAAIRAYPGLSNAKRVTFEYVMLKDVNDTDADASGAGEADRLHPGQINLDPVQSLAGRAVRDAPSPGPSARAAISQAGAGYASPVRRLRGRDILAACGQLKSESEKVRASERRRQAAIPAASAD